MSHISLADLEAELGCFDQGLVEIGELLSDLRVMPVPTWQQFLGPIKDHGDSDKIFEVPAEATSRLEPPSKTKSVYPFGVDGTLAWATPAGELLQFASCIKDKLAGVDYKKSIEKGKDYLSRAKMLETALSLPQGSGNGIGLSLNLNLHPTNVHWVHNRWPRFMYHFRGMEIRLQYYVTSQSIVQQYLIRNDGNEETSLPYTISTDILFRDHELDEESFKPVSTQKSSERLMLAQNSELFVRNDPNDVQFEIAVFLNKQRLSIWIDNQANDSQDERGDDRGTEVSDQGLPKIEKALREAIVDRKRMPVWAERFYRNQYTTESFETRPRDQRLRDNKCKNFAKFYNTLVVPGGSSQELCTIVKVSGPLHSETEINQSTSKPVGAQSTDSIANRQDRMGNEETVRSKCRHEENALQNQGDVISFDASDTTRRHQVTQLMTKRSLLGQAFASVAQFGQARYYLFTASLIAEVVHQKDIYLLSKARFRYAKFLLRCGWQSDGLKIMEDLVQNLSKEEGKMTKTNRLWSDVRMQLASEYLNLSKFSSAEGLYQQILQHLNHDDSALGRVSAQLWERIAWAKVNLGQYEQASEIYNRFLKQGSASRQILFSNLGFIKRRLGQHVDAQNFYELALQEPYSTSTHSINRIFARGGLSSCLRSLRATPERVDALSASSIKYIDINDTLSQVQHLSSPNREDPFGLVLSRHLETLLSLCSVPIKRKDVLGIIFVDADPVECVYDGRNAL